VCGEREWGMNGQVQVQVCPDRNCQYVVCEVSSAAFTDWSSCVMVSGVGARRCPRGRTDPLVEERRLTHMAVIFLVVNCPAPSLAYTEACGASDVTSDECSKYWTGACSYIMRGTSKAFFELTRKDRWFPRMSTVL
jgi:hypothetical protein